MNHSNMYIVGLALCTFANIASEEMSRDLCNEIEKLMSSANSYIRKKAVLCAKRIIRKVPDLVDHFRHRTLQLLSDKSHGVLLCTISLAIQICETDPSSVALFRRATSSLVAMLRNLLSTSFSPEHDVAGVTDPFLQAKILRFMRVLGRDSAEVSDMINDILAQVATNTDGSKIVGNSILYECVLTILDIKADSGLRVMAINILGKFLGNHDNNIRYVALNTLIKVVSIDTNAVQRHRATILACLRDVDISIRRRALELAYTLINENTVLPVMHELLQFLEVADTEFKLGLTTRIGMAAERFAPNVRWHMDTMLHVLRVAGQYVREEVLASFLRLVCHTPELHAYAVEQLYVALHSDMSQLYQTLAAVWVIGEYGDLLFERGSVEIDGSVYKLDPKSVIDVLAMLLDSVYATEPVREYTLTALPKLYTRMQDVTQQKRIQSILAQYDESIDLETQKRALEYGALLKRASIRDAVMEVMPLPLQRPLTTGSASEAQSSLGAAAAASSAATSDSLLLDTDAGASSTGGASTTPAPKQNAHDLLADIFGSGNESASQNTSSASSTASTVTKKPSSAQQDILGLFDSPAASEHTATSDVARTTSAFGEMDLLGSSGDDTSSMSKAPTPLPEDPPVYSKNGLNLALVVTRQEGKDFLVQARFLCTSGAVESIMLQAAVPKTQHLQMHALSKSTLYAGEQAMQDMDIAGVMSGKVRLRIRLIYRVRGEEVRDQLDWTQP